MYSCITLDNGSKHVLYLQVLIYCTYIAVLKCNFSIKKNGICCLLQQPHASIPCLHVRLSSIIASLSFCSISCDSLYIMSLKCIKSIAT